MENINIILHMLKLFFIILCTYYSDIKILNVKHKNENKIIILIISAILLLVIIDLLNGYINMTQMNTMMLIIIYTSIITAILYQYNIFYSLLLNSISLSIIQMIMFIISMALYFPYRLMGINNKYINFMGIAVCSVIMLILIWKTKRLRKGLAFFKQETDNEYIRLLMINISVGILFAMVIIPNYKQGITSQFGVMLIIFSIIMCITIQKSLQLYYKHKMLIKTLEQTKEELEKAKSDVKKLEEENLNFSKISHTIAHKQKALQHKLEMLSKSNNNIETEKIKKQINDVTKELKQSRNVELTKTGIEEIDNILDYMQSECIKNNIEFQLQVSGNIHHMVNNYINKDDLETILADHIKDAIIAIKHTETTNRKILVRLGKINGVYAVYFCDTGVEFEINTLMELGKKPATTYKDEGGTGMGFMNTFDTLEKTRASLIIEEMSRPKENNFTKIIKVVFDNKKEYKILSYRYQEIEKQKTRNNLIIEKL